MNEYESEYGVSADVDGAREWDALGRSGAGPRVMTRGRYVAAVRDVARRAGVELPTSDGRILSLGLDRIPPREWVLGEVRPRAGSDRPGDWAADERRLARPGRTLTAFWAFWREVAERPSRIGSTYNPDPDLAFAAWLLTLRHRGLRGMLRAVPGEHWSLLRGRDGGISRRAARRAREIGRALRRASLARAARGTCVGLFRRDALVVLGALPALAQDMVASWALEHHGDARWSHTEAAPLRARDLPWDLIRAELARLESPLYRAERRLRHQAVQEDMGRIPEAERVTLAVTALLAPPDARGALSPAEMAAAVTGADFGLLPPAERRALVAAYPEAIDAAHAAALAVHRDDPVGGTAAELTAAEAGWYLAHGAGDPVTWVLDQYGAPVGRDTLGTSTESQHPAVRRWLLEMGRAGEMFALATTLVRWRECRHTQPPCGLRWQDHFGSERSAPLIDVAGWSCVGAIDAREAAHRYEVAAWEAYADALRSDLDAARRELAQRGAA